MNSPNFLLKFLPLFVVGTALAMSACSSSANFIRQRHSPLPIEAQHALNGRVVSTGAFETRDRLFVSGSIGKSIGTPILPAAHVDVHLIDSSGNIVAEKQDDIVPVHPRLSRARGRRHSYVVSFPIEEARRASKIVVAYHVKRHSP